MAWCPQCKNEYREGVKVCSDCGCDLIEDEQYDDLVPLIIGEEDKLKLLKKYLEYNKLKGVTVKFDEEDSVYKLYVRKDDSRHASSMASVFMQQEFLREQEALAEQMTEDMYEDDEEEQEPSENEEDVSSDEAVLSPGGYHNSSERAQDNRSSAWTLMIVGGVGLIAMILGIVGVIPLRLGNPYMFYGVMCAVFLLFIVMGVVSMKNAKVFAKRAESENTLRDAMTQWYQENLDAVKIDEGLEVEEDTPDEILYFKRVQKIKDMFNHQFMNLDQGFLERYIDEEVYDYIFSSEEA